MSIFVFVSFSAVNGISFSSAFSFTAENEKCFSVGLQYTSQKGLGLEKGLITSLFLKTHLSTYLYTILRTSPDPPTYSRAIDFGIFLDSLHGKKRNQSLPNE